MQYQNNNFNPMFDLCKKVNVYNIQNHYYCNERTENTYNLKQKLKHVQLQANPISVTSSLNSKRGSINFQKRGLQLSKALYRETSECKHNKRQSQGQMCLKPLSSLRNKNISQKYSHDILVSTKQSHYSQIHNKQPFLYDPVDIIHSKYQSIQAKPDSIHCSSIQNIPKKMKPINISMMRTLQTIPCGSQRLVETSYSALANQNMDSSYRSNKITEQKMNSSRNSYDRNNSEVSFILQQTNSISDSDMSHNIQRQLDDSLGLSPCSRQNFEATFDNNNKCYTQQLQYKIDQPSYSDNKKTNQQLLPSKHLHIPKNSASIILSQILSRDSSLHQLHPQNNNKNARKKSKLFKDLDRITIKSVQAAEFSQFSLHVQQSIMCDHNPHHNFICIHKEDRQNYSLSVSLEKITGCIVTLKQLSFNHMDMIALQLQMYELLDSYATKLACYRNIQSLLQVQVTASTYLLIKQPYQMSLASMIQQQIRNGHKIRVDKIKQELQKLVNMIWQDFLHIKIQLRHKLRLCDFVSSLGVIKLQNLSSFKFIGPTDSLIVQSCSQTMADLSQQINDLIIISKVDQ